MKTKCPYCKVKAVKVSGMEIYPHRPDLHKKMFYSCPECDAYVGTHTVSGKPLGTLANGELREKRRKLHVVFEPLWNGTQGTRREAYTWLASKLNIPEAACHIGMFDSAACDKALEIITNMKE